MQIRKEQMESLEAILGPEAQERCLLEMEALWRTLSPDWVAGFTTELSEAERREVWEDMIDWADEAGVEMRAELHSSAMLVARAMCQELDEEAISGMLDVIEEAGEDREEMIRWMDLALSSGAMRA